MKSGGDERGSGGRARIGSVNRWIFLGTMTALLAGAFLVRAEGGPALCASKRLFGISCPGCGMVRSVTAFAQGRFGESLRYHLFGPLVFGAAAALWVAAMAGVLRRREYRAPDTPAFNAALSVALILLLGYWIGRMATGTTP